MLPAHLPITVITPGPGVSWTHLRAAAALDTCCSGCHTSPDTPVTIASLHHEVAASAKAEHLSAAGEVSGGGEGAGDGGEGREGGNCQGGVTEPPSFAISMLPS